jgi:hypothetical protein
MESLRYRNVGFRNDATERRLTQTAAERDETGPYVDRAYERDLVQQGRRIVSLDIDASLLDRIDDMRRVPRVRRGLAIERLLRLALDSQGTAMT